MDWLYKAMLTATTVALLLALAQRCGRRTAGLVAGLPIIAAPALVWLAHAHGPAFAAEAGAGCMSAGGLCALFALGYGRASRRAGPAAALLAGGGLALLPVPLLAQWRPNDGVLMALALACCAASTALLRALPQPGRPPQPTPRRPATVGASAQVALTAGASGAVSGGVGLFAADLGAFWAGVVASAPLVAAAVSIWLHHHRGSVALPPFLHGYLAGLIGRTCFAALFALLVVPLGAMPAVLLAGSALCLSVWLNGRRALARDPALTADVTVR